MSAFPFPIGSVLRSNCCLLRTDTLSYVTIIPNKVCCLCRRRRRPRCRARRLVCSAVPIPVQAESFQTAVPDTET